MSHNDLSRPYAMWGSGSVPNARDFIFWDTAQFKAINGDLGGAWTPSTPVVIGGAGLSLDAGGGATGHSIIAGGVTTQSGGRLRLGASDFATFGSTITRTILMPIAALAQQRSTNTGAINGLSTLVLSQAPFLGALNAVAGGNVPNSITVPIPARYMHHGATLVSATLAGRVSSLPPRLATKILSANVFAMSSTGALTGSLAPYSGTGIPRLPNQWIQNTSYPAAGLYVFPKITGTSSGQTGLYYKCTTNGVSNVSTQPVWPTVIGNTVTDGTVVWTAWGYGSLPQPSILTTHGYYQNGFGQSLPITPYQTLTVDTTANTYYLQIQPDDCGAPWLWTSLLLSYAAIADLHFE